MNSIGIELVWITVKDIKSAIQFYKEVIGFQLLEYSEKFHWAELAGPEGSRLGLAQFNPQDPEFKPGTNAIPTITVKDLEEAIEQLARNKATIVGEILEIPGHVKMQSFRDADGKNFQICEVLK